MKFHVYGENTVCIRGGVGFAEVVTEGAPLLEEGLTREAIAVRDGSL